MIKLLVTSIAAALSLLMAANITSAQEDWPARPVQIIVPFAAGGSGDLLARMAAQYLSAKFKQRFVVENRPGSGGIVGTRQFLAEPADGYTLGEGSLSTLSLVPVINSNATYDPDKNFTHIAYVGGSPVVLAANPQTRVKTLAEFVAYANAPGKTFTFSSSGLGSDGQLWGEMIARSTKVKPEHIPYKATAQALIDVVGGQVPFCTFTLSSTSSFLHAKTLNGVAVTAPERLAEFPDIPTFKELAKPELVGTTWFSLEGPPGMPKSIAEKINQAIRAAVASPEVRGRFRSYGILAQPMNVQEFTAFVAAENVKWKTLIQSVGLVGAVH